MIKDSTTLVIFVLDLWQPVRIFKAHLKRYFCIVTRWFNMLACHLIFLFNNPWILLQIFTIINTIAILIICKNNFWSSKSYITSNMWFKSESTVDSDSSNLHSFSNIPKYWSKYLDYSLACIFISIWAEIMCYLNRCIYI